MKNTLTKYLAVAVAVVTLFGSCRKDAYETDSAAGKGQSFVRIYDAPLKKIFFDAFTGTKTATLFNIRRDANSNASLKAGVTVKLKDLGQAYLDTYNEANGTSYEVLTTDIYSFSNPSIVTKTATGLDINVASGADIAKIEATLNGGKFDLSKKYALAYAIEDAGGLGIKAGTDTIVVALGIKNYLEGTYGATGVFTHPTAGPRAISQNKYLETNGANSVVTTVGDLANTFEIIVDPVTHNVSFNGAISDGQPIVPVPGTVNKYDPATKTFTLNYQYNGAGTPGLNYRVIQEDLVFKSR